MNVRRKTVSSIYNSSGVEVTSRTDLERAHVDFYQNLFTSEDIDFPSQSDLFSRIHIRLSTDESALCEGFVSVKEITTSAKSLSLGKSSGPDGFTLEFLIINGRFRVCHVMLLGCTLDASI